MLRFTPALLFGQERSNRCVFIPAESFDGGDNTATGRAGHTGVRGGESTPFVNGQRGDELVTHASAAGREHLLWRDVDDLVVSIEFGAHMVNCVDTTCIKLDYTVKLYFDHSVLLLMLSLTVVRASLLTNVIERAGHDKEDVQ